MQRYRQTSRAGFLKTLGASGVLFAVAFASAQPVPNEPAPGAATSRVELPDQSTAGAPAATSPNPAKPASTSTPSTSIEKQALGAPRSLPIAPRREASSPTDMLHGVWRTGGALAAVLSVAVALAWFTKRLARTRGTLSAAIGPGGASPSGVLEVLGRYPLSRGITLILLKIDARVLLVSQSLSRAGCAMQTLCEITEPEQVASILLKASQSERSSIADRFQSLLASNDRAIDRALGQGESHAVPRQVFRTSSGDTVELASVSKPVPLARRPSHAANDTPRAASTSAASTNTSPRADRGYASTNASRPLTGAEQLRRRLDAWREREERSS